MVSMFWIWDEEGRRGLTGVGIESGVIELVTELRERVESTVHCFRIDLVHFPKFYQSSLGSLNDGGCNDNVLLKLPPTKNCRIAMIDKCDF